MRQIIRHSIFVTGGGHRSGLLIDSALSLVVLPREAAVTPTEKGQKDVKSICCESTN
jgi:hypothetical protein